MRHQHCLINDEGLVISAQGMGLTRLESLRAFSLIEISFYTCSHGSKPPGLTAVASSIRAACNSILLVAGPVGSAQRVKKGRRDEGVQTGQAILEFNIQSMFRYCQNTQARQYIVKSHNLLNPSNASYVQSDKAVCHLLRVNI